LFTGPPGSGKTFTMKYVLDGSTLPETTVGGTLSHAAKEVLSESLGDSARCYTIAQLLGQKPYTNVYGKQVFKADPKGERHIRKGKVVIIDECSMVTNSMYREILDYALDDAKIIFMGDPYQLPPVGEVEEPLVFQIENNARLTESVRFSGAIGEVAVYFKQYQQYLIEAGQYGDMSSLYGFRFYDDNPESLVWFYSDEETFKEYAIDRFSKDIHGTRVLAYRNTVIDSYNDSLRSHFINSEHPITEGERIILNAPYESRDGARLHNGEVYEILGYEITSIPIVVTEPISEHSYETRLVRDNYLVYEVKLQHIFKKEVTVANILHPGDGVKHKTKLDQLVANAKQDRTLWSQYYSFRENFLNWSRMYAMTTHKAQGQSINNVFVMANDILEIEKIDLVQKMQSLYVAATRARKELHVLL
jgi:exodeoxyribonuclease-5